MLLPKFVKIISKWQLAAAFVVFASLSVAGAQSLKPIKAVAKPASEYTQYRISDVEYTVKGLTRKYALIRAVPVDTHRIFHSMDELAEYTAALRKSFLNIRSIAQAEITTICGNTDDNAVTPVQLMVAITDTWNIIAIPYPSFDSNTGVEVKVKLKDFNFIGTLQPLEANLTYQVSEEGVSKYSSGFSFSFPFKANIFNMVCSANASISGTFETIPTINLGTGLTISYSFKKIDISFGILPYIVINDRYQGSPDDDNNPLQSTSETTTKKKNIPAGKVYPYDRYYFKTRFSLSTPITITKIPHFGILKWTPSAAFNVNWKFGSIHAKHLRIKTISLRHSFTFGHLDWICNFKKGALFALSNSHSYNILKSNHILDFTLSVTGHYPLWNRIAVYSNIQFFYNLFGTTTSRPGGTLRGILNNRISTDTAFMLNLDFPIKIAAFDFQKITGVSWSRFFNCEIHISPFFDMALIHDSTTNRYYHPLDGWYAGGFEVIVFPQKMRSIFVRTSIGFDLTELKNVPGFNKFGGIAKRDNHPISELFIGIGMHY